MIRQEFDGLRDAVGRAARRAGLGCTVLFLNHRTPGDCGRWAKAPGPRAAVAYLDVTAEPVEVAARMIDLIVEANQQAGGCFDQDEVVELLAAAAQPFTTGAVA